MVAVTILGVELVLHPVEVPLIMVVRKEVEQLNLQTLPQTAGREVTTTQILVVLTKHRYLSWRVGAPVLIASSYMYWGFPLTF